MDSTWNQIVIVMIRVVVVTTGPKDRLMMMMDSSTIMEEASCFQLGTDGEYEFPIYIIFRQLGM